MMEALFYRCYYAYLKGNFEETKTFFNFLKEEFHKTQNKEALNKYQLKHLKKISEALKTGIISNSTWIQFNEEDDDVVKTGKSDKNHIQLVRAIYDSRDELKEVLRIKDDCFHLYNIECPCGQYGRIDMVFKDNTYIYPVEVKPGLGGHDIIGQILKYDLYLRLKTHLKFWSDVKPITICWDYSKFVKKELKKRNIIPIKHHSIKNKLKFECA